MTGPEHIGDVLARALGEIAVRVELLGSPKAAWLYRAIADKPPAEMKALIVDAATEHTAVLLPCEAIALISALGLESV